VLPRRLDLPDDSAGEIAALAAHVRALAVQPAGLTEAVRQIFEEVRLRGDEAIVELSRRFDSPESGAAFRLSHAELQQQLEELDPAVRAGLEVAIENVGRVAGAELREPVRVDLREGQRVELRDVPIGRAGVYVPGGRAAYPSTVVMCCVPALIAGVSEIAVATPPGPDGTGNAVALAACALCGIEEVYLMGGAQAIAAFAYGTAIVPAVDVVVGPGNAYVQEAKRQAVGLVGIDGIEGPSEVVIVAGGDADPHIVALDLAAQAEHGADSLVVLISPSSELLDAVAEETVTMRAERPSVSDAPLALVAAPSLEAGVALADEIAPEHLELAFDGAETAAASVRRAGCVFVGQTGGAAFGDYVAGSNHVLPTGGAARFAGPLGASTFRRRQALVSLPAEAARALAPHVGSIARAEGYPVHAESAEARLAPHEQGR
jgi:histidinol dehydrogenase